MTITSIERQKKNTSRRSVFLDGAFAFGISDDILLKFQLFEGREVSSEEISAIERAELEHSVRSAALKYRSYRPRSAKEMSDYLQKKGFEPALVEKGIEYLISINLLNDEEFAAMIARDRLHLRPIGKMALKNVLYKKGVSKEIVEKTIETWYSADIENGMALREAEKKLKRISSLPSLARKKRLYEHLMRRGYDSSLSHSVVNQLIR